jgi:hypothetical protein
MSDTICGYNGLSEWENFKISNPVRERIKKFFSG